jgi:hypothetical protein
VFSRSIKGCPADLQGVMRGGLSLASGSCVQKVKVKGLYIYPSVLFKNTLKNYIQIHKNFIDQNSEKFKNNLKNIQY